MHFEITEKLTTDCESLYNNAGLISKVPEEIASENAGNCRCRQPHYSLNFLEYPHKPYIARKYPVVIGLHFCRWSYGSTFIQIFVVGSKRRIFSAIECVSAVHGHPMSLILAPIERAYATSY